MLSEEQTNQIKQQLIQQVETSFPEDKKAEFIQQIQEMNPEQLIEFLKQNNMIKNEGDLTQPQENCIFCSIAQGKIPSTIIKENNSAVAVLELNPISKAHTIILTKEHITKPEDLPQEAKDLGTEVAQILQQKLSPKKVEVIITNTFGHEIINLLPIYNNETINSPRQKTSKEELEELKNFLTENPVEEIEEIPEEPEPAKEITEENTWLPRRVP